MRGRISRREFIKNSTKGAIAVALVPPFLGSAVGRAFAMPSGADMKLSDYMKHFGVNRNLLNSVMEEGLSRGGDFCDLFFEHRITSHIGLDDDIVNRAYTDVDFGVGIRVLKGDQTGYSFTEEITPKAMRLAARTAANIADSGRKIEPVELKLHRTPNYYPIEIPWEEISIDRKIPKLQMLNDRVKDLDARVIKATVWFADQTAWVMIANSEGRIVTDYRPQSYIYAGCVAEQNGQREENGFYSGGRTGMEYYDSERIDHVAKETVRRTVDLFDAVRPDGGEMEVVLAGGSAGILLHEAIGHGMEADFNRKKISIYCDKMNQPVAESFVSIVDDGIYKNARGTINVDDEGNDTEKTYVVRDGILVSYMHDRISAKHYGVAPTGNGRRQSFRFPPIPRMTNTYMLAGPHSREEIIKSVKHGLYAEHFTNGQVLIGAGDFTFYVKSGYMIENGEIAKAVKDINIIGNGPEVLRNIVMVADDFALTEGGGTCGKDDQRVPVTDGLPTAKVSKITVGGV